MDTQIYTHWFLSYMHLEMQTRSGRLIIKPRVTNSKLYTDQENIIHDWDNLRKEHGSKYDREAQEPSKETASTRVQPLHGSSLYTAGRNVGTLLPDLPSV